MFDSDPNKLPEDVRQKLLLIRTALIHENVQEANHWLYSIACPSFTCYDPWAALEGRQCACGPHSLHQHCPPPTVDQLVNALATVGKTGVRDNERAGDGSHCGKCMYSPIFCADECHAAKKLRSIARS